MALIWFQGGIYVFLTTGSEYNQGAIVYLFFSTFLNSSKEVPDDFLFALNRLAA